MHPVGGDPNEQISSVAVEVESNFCPVTEGIRRLLTWPYSNLFHGKSDFLQIIECYFLPISSNIWYCFHEHAGRIWNSCLLQSSYQLQWQLPAAHVPNPGSFPSTDCFCSAAKWQVCMFQIILSKSETWRKWSVYKLAIMGGYLFLRELDSNVDEGFPPVLALQQSLLTWLCAIV